MTKDELLKSIIAGIALIRQSGDDDDSMVVSFLATIDGLVYELIDYLENDIDGYDVQPAHDRYDR